MGKKIVIGDVHGCWEELSELIERVGWKGYRRDSTEEDEFVFLGDLIDKGPFSAAVLGTVRSLESRTKVTRILGNHEERFLRFVKYEMASETSGKNNPMQYVPEEFHSHMRNMSMTNIQDLERSVLNYQFTVAGKKYICVHAGLPSGVSKLDDRSSHRKNQNPYLRIRYVDHSDRFVSLGKEKPDYKYWAERYDGKFGYCLFGHQVHKQEDSRYAHAMALDGGCVHGQELRALVIHGDGTEEVVSVPAYEKYAEVYKPEAKGL